MAVRAFLIEDHAEVRESLVETLKELARVDVVGHADNEADARAWLNSHPLGWDVLIADIFLRGGNGVSVLSACKSRAAGQRLVVLTGHATPEIRRICLDLGVDGVFDKSIDTEALIDYCSNIAAR